MQWHALEKSFSVRVSTGVLVRQPKSKMCSEVSTKCRTFSQLLHGSPDSHNLRAHITSKRPAKMRLKRAPSITTLIPKSKPLSEVTNIIEFQEEKIANTVVSNKAKAFELQEEEKIAETVISDKPKAFVKTGSVVTDLKNFAELHGIAKPVVTVFERKSKQSRRSQYDCKIKIDGQLFSSYGPEEYYDATSAKYAAFKEALTHLLEKYGEVHTCSLPVSVDKSIIERIPEIVGNHQHGVWNWQAEVEYKEKHKEQLPPHWLQLVNTLSVINVEKYGDKYILCQSNDVHIKHNLSQLETSIIQSQQETFEHYLEDAKTSHPFEIGKTFEVSVVHKKNELSPPISPPSIPSTGILKSPYLVSSNCHVWIPYVINPGNFFIQPLKYRNQLAEMMTRLQAAFIQRNVKPVKWDGLRIGNIYAAQHSDGMWYRICVLKIIHPAGIVVFYVDYGYYENLNCMQIYSLDEWFLQLPFQAVKAKLAGVKPIHAEYSLGASTFFKQLVQQLEYIATTIAVEVDELCPKDKVMVVKLTNPSSQGVPINELLIQEKMAVLNF